MGSRMRWRRLVWARVDGRGNKHISSPMHRTDSLYTARKQHFGKLHFGDASPASDYRLVQIMGKCKVTTP
jgi:hypothetical protein